MRRLNSRIDRLERRLGDALGARRCPCLGGGVWRMRVNGQRQFHENDAVYDETWHCRHCGAAAPEVNVVTPGLMTGAPG